MHNHSDYRSIIRDDTCIECAVIVADYAINNIYDEDLIFLYNMIDRDFQSLSDQERAEQILVDIQRRRNK